MNSPLSILVRSVGTIAALAAVLFCSLTAQAAVVTVYSNPYAEVATTNSQISGSNFFATGFTTSADSSLLTLKSIDLALASSGTSSMPIVQLFSGNTMPTSLIGNFTVSPFTNLTPASINLAYGAGTVQLAPQTTYWIVASASAGDAYGWYIADSNPAAQNSSGYNFVGGATSTNGGSTYSHSNAAGASQVAVNVETVVAMNVETVPEPSTLVLAGVGLTTAVMIGGVRRKKQSRHGQAGLPHLGRA